MGLVRRFAWLLPLKLGLGFVAGGIYMISQGLAAKKEVRTALVSEQIITHSEARIPRALVQDAATAAAQEEVIRTHSLRETDSKTFAQIPRGDPMRDYYLHAVTLRTALGLAIMGFKISDLVVGMGAFMAATGAALVVMAPALRPATREEPD